MYDNEIYGYKNKNKISYSDAIAINELKKMRNDKKKNMKRELRELILTRLKESAKKRWEKYRSWTHRRIL